MKREDILAIERKPILNDGKIITLNILDRILVIDCYEDKRYLGRYWIDLDTGRYGGYNPETGAWNCRKLVSLFGYDPVWTGIYFVSKEVYFESEEDAETAKAALETRKAAVYDLLADIDDRER